MAISWIALTTTDQVQEIIGKSHQKPCLIFKHSTRCSISSIAMCRLEDDWDFDPQLVNTYHLDLLRHRPVSNMVAEHFQVHHESPQVLLIRNGTCIYDESHLGIRVNEIREVLS